MTATNSVISYPIPPYQNLPIQPEFYKPRKYFISNITLGNTTTVQTSVANDYVIGNIIRLLVPQSFGSWQLNEQTGILIQILSTTQFVLNIDSSGMDTYISSSATTKAQCLAIGDVNSGAINSDGRNNTLTYIQGSFQNISPQ